MIYLGLQQRISFGIIREFHHHARSFAGFHLRVPSRMLAIFSAFLFEFRQNFPKLFSNSHTFSSMNLIKNSSKETCGFFHIRIGILKKKIHQNLYILSTRLVIHSQISLRILDDFLKLIFQRFAKETFQQTMLQVNQKVLVRIPLGFPQKFHQIQQYVICLNVPT